MSMLTAQALRCVLPQTVRRGVPGSAQAMAGGAGQIVRTMPETRPRRYAPEVQSAALASAGISCRLPDEFRRSGGTPTAIQQGIAPGAIRRSLPLPVARAASAPANMAGRDPSPEPGPGSDPTSPPAAPRDRAPLSVAALLPIVERVARGISGAAGYAYIGEEPEGAGVRYGLLGLRLDTGDMGGALRLAAARDAAAVAAALGDHAAELLATAQAADRSTRLGPVAGAALWAEPWKGRLSRAAGGDVFRAGQNEYAVEHLLRPAAETVLMHPALMSGTALAMALDLLAEMGREAGLAALTAALSSGADSLASFRDRLTAACPACRLRIEALARDKALAAWVPEPPRAQP